MGDDNAGGAVLRAFPDDELETQVHGAGLDGGMVLCLTVDERMGPRARQYDPVQGAWTYQPVPHGAMDYLVAALTDLVERLPPPVPLEAVKPTPREKPVTLPGSRRLANLRPRVAGAGEDGAT